MLVTTGITFKVAILHVLIRCEFFISNPEALMYWPRYRSVNTSSLVGQIKKSFDFCGQNFYLEPPEFPNYVVCKFTARYTCGNTEMDSISKTIQFGWNQSIDRMCVRLTCFTLTDTKNRQNWHFKQLRFLSSFIK